MKAREKISGIPDPENQPANEKEHISGILKRYENARKRHETWQSLWQECYNFALPQRDAMSQASRTGQSRMERIYDGTALDAVDQLASSLLGNLTPPWTDWAGLKPGPDMRPEEAEAATPLLEKASQTLQAHFDRSNFAVEIHQAYLDLVTAGTASLAFEETAPGAPSAFSFNSVPLGAMVLGEGATGQLDHTFRKLELTRDQIAGRYPSAEIPDSLQRFARDDPDTLFEVLESVLPAHTGTYLSYNALLKNPESGEFTVLAARRFNASPFINFRWLKSPGEIYGRSPVMKALPDIKTANKVVELILKNASIAVTGIWQAEDDGVLNPANISLQPGTIISKAVGSDGLKPLEMPGRFDVSQLVLEDLRSRIRHTLLADRLPQINDRRMTATEVLERGAQTALLLGANYGRLQSELLTPLITRGYEILRRRGEIPDLALDGRLVEIDFRAPLARAQAQRNIQNTLTWIDTAMAYGGTAQEAINLPEAIRHLGRALGVPPHLIRNELPPEVTEAIIQSQPQPQTQDPTKKDEVHDEQDQSAD